MHRITTHAAQSSRKIRIFWLTLQISFLAAVGVSVAVIISRNYDALAEALLNISIGLMIGAVTVTGLGSFIIGYLWLQILRIHVENVVDRQVLAAFFVGQLGKYIPGGLWSFGAQAALNARYAVPLSRTLATSGLLLFLLLASSLAVGSASPWIQEKIGSIFVGTVVVGLLTVLTFVAPYFYALVVKRRAQWLLRRLTWNDCFVWFVLQLSTWMLFGFALALLALPFRQQNFLSFTFIMVASSCLAFGVGALFVFAPAGLGVREVVLVGLLAPHIGMTGALAVTALSRAISVFVDVTLAALATLLLRKSTLRK